MSDGYIMEVDKWGSLHLRPTNGTSLNLHPSASPERNGWQTSPSGLVHPPLSTYHSAHLNKLLNFNPLPASTSSGSYLVASSGSYIVGGVTSGYPPISTALEVEKGKRALPLVGLRAWTPVLKRHGWELHSLGVLDHWLPGRTEKARCKYQSHDAPNLACECGLYAWRGFQTRPDGVNGLVVMWGKVVQHGSEGIRGQFARIVAILKTANPPIQNVLQRKSRWLGWRNVTEVGSEGTYRQYRVDVEEAVAAAFGVPLLDEQGIRLLAGEYGDQIA